MDKEQGIQPVPIIYDQASISLPLDESAFREFMVSLLGQPESIEGYIEGAFEIDLGKFEQLNHLIDDRIAKQNQSSLLEFRAKLFFSDGSSMSFNGVHNFQNYRELRPLICEGFIFTWSYLVKFNDKQVSEKQEISVSSVEEDVSSNTKTKRKKSILLGFDLGLSDKIPKISYSARCTDKGWGIEITELIRKYFLGFTKTNTSFWIILRRKIIENFKAVEYSCMLLAYFFLIGLTWQSSETGLTECRSLSGQSSQFVKDNISIDEKIDFLVQLVSACNSKVSSFISFVLPMLLFFATAFLLPILIHKLVQLPNYRFLLFTEASKSRRDEYFRKINDRRSFWVVTILVGLIIGTLGNFAFTWLISFFR